MSGEKRGLALAFFRSEEKAKEIYQNKKFLVWGSLDFLDFWSYSSLATIKQEDPFIENSQNHYDIRKLYLYSQTGTEAEHKWILSAMESHPLLVISILDAPSSEEVDIALQKVADANLIYKVFKTFGPGNKIVLFRTNSYSKVLNILTRLSDLFNNSYSIAAIQMPPSGLKSNWLRGQVEGDGIATVKYRLLERKQKTSLKQAKILLNKAERQFHKDVPQAEIKVEAFYEIGQYDIEVRLQGGIEYLLYILLNSSYGLVNADNPFYKKVILSKTIWKIEASDE